MYQKLLRKIAEEKPSYHEEEIQWLLDHLGDSSPEIRDDLVFTSFAIGIQEELFTHEQFYFIAEEILSDGGLDKEIDKVGLSTLERSFRALIYANLLSAHWSKVDHVILLLTITEKCRCQMLDRMKCRSKPYQQRGF